MISQSKHSLRANEVVTLHTSGSQQQFRYSHFQRSFKHLQQLALFFVVAGLLTGCDLFKGDDEASDLDQLLEETLADVSPNSSVDFFNMPASTDFNAIPQDPKNPVTTKKVELGQLLYHETALLVNNVRPEGRYTSSCAACHNAKAGFQAGRIQGVGEGGSGFGERGENRINHTSYAESELDIQPIRTPSAMNGAYQKVNLWNGQFGATGPNTGTEALWTPDTPIATNELGYEGLETQAIGGLEVHRMGDIDSTIVVTHPTYTQLFAEAFPGKPIDREHAGLAIAAYERTLLANEAPFQRWLDGTKNAMTEQEKRGAIVFFGKAQCADCHSGPALSSMTFHALGMNELNGPGVYGGDHSGASARLGRGSFTGDAADNYKFKTPQLYNLTDSPFFGHGGSFKTVREVVEYKNNAIAENAEVPAGQLAAEFKPLGLTEDEIEDLVVFIESALNDPNLERYVPDSVPSGNCIIVNDMQAQADLGCN